MFFFFCSIVFDFAGLFLVAILVQNLCTGDPCEGVRSLPSQTKTPRYGHGQMDCEQSLICSKVTSIAPPVLVATLGASLFVARRSRFVRVRSTEF